MSNVRVLVGTRKGAFILTADGQRRSWEVSGPHFGGWEVYHLVVPIKNDSEHFPPEGKLRVYRSRTGGNEWEPLFKGLPQ